MPAWDGSKLDKLDLIAVAAYFVAVFLVAVYGTIQAKKHENKESYFLGGRMMSWLPVGCSLFVSNIGSEHFVGLAGSGAKGGVGVGAWEFIALFMLLLLGWVFVPVYLSSQIYTMPEYLGKRFGGNRCRMYLTFVSMLLYIFTKTSVNLYTGGLFIQQAMGFGLYESVIGIIIVTALMTMAGGLTVVVYTETFQCLCMVIGGITLMSISFHEVGGFWGLYDKWFTEIPSDVPSDMDPSCYEPPQDGFRMLKAWDDPDMPWLGFLLGQTPKAVWYWCTDQVIVQRVLAAKNVTHAQGATLFAAVVKVLPLFMMVMPGMISRVLFPDEVACVDPDVCYEVCESRVGCTNIAYVRLVLGVMPTGVKGIMMSVMIAALMSDLESIFNSSSTVFTVDIFNKLRPEATQKEQIWAARGFIGFMTAAAVAWLPILKNAGGGQIFVYIHEVSSYLAPPIAAVFLCGLFISRANEIGAWTGFIFGFIFGVARLIVVLVYSVDAPIYCGDADNRPAFISEFQYMYYAAFLFFGTVFTVVVVSYCTQPPGPELLDKTTYWTRFGEKSVEDEKWNNTTNAKTDNDKIQLVLNDDDTEKYDPGEIVDPSSYLLQDPKTKWFLNTILFIIFSIGVFNFAFWSLFDFDKIHP